MSAQQSYSEPNPLRQIDVLTKGTLDHKNGGCADVCPWRAKGQDDKSEGERRQAVLDGDACTSRRERPNPHPPQNQTQTPGPFKEGDVTSLYGWGWRLWYHTSKTRARGDASKTGGVHTGLQNYCGCGHMMVALVDLTCRLWPIYINTNTLALSTT